MATTTELRIAALPVSGMPSAIVARTYAGLAVTVGCWGLMPVVLKQLLQVFDPLEVAFLRFFLSGVVLLAIVLATQPHELIGALRRNARGVLLSSIVGPVLAMTVLNFAISAVGVGVASVSAALNPIWTCLIAIALGHERGSLPRLLSILLCLGGLAMVVATDVKAEDSFWIGLIATCLAPLIWAANTMISKQLVAKESPLVLVTVNMLIGSVFLAPFQSGHLLAKLGALETKESAALTFCVLAGTVLGYALWYGSLRMLAPSTISVAVIAIPLVSLVGGVVVYGEPLTVLKSVGITVVLYGLYLVNVKHRPAET